jgi:hypothetical protein
MNNNNFAKTKISVDLAIVETEAPHLILLKTVLISPSMLKNGAMIDFG